MVEFKNAATLAKYDTVWNTDPTIHIPGGKKANGWRGKLSDITVENADRLMDQKSNLLKLKVPGPVAEVKEKPGKKNKEADETVIQ